MKTQRGGGALTHTGGVGWESSWQPIYLALFFLAGNNQCVSSHVWDEEAEENQLTQMFATFKEKQALKCIDICSCGVGKVPAKAKEKFSFAISLTASAFLYCDALRKLLHQHNGTASKGWWKKSYRMPEGVLKARGPSRCSLTYIVEVIADLCDSCLSVFAFLSCDLPGISLLFFFVCL